MSKAIEIKGVAPDENMETCARLIIVGHFREMMSYKDGAIDGTNIEFVHDMRVASRRLRAAMDNFSDCFESKPFKQLYKQVRTITRTMGAVRDLDVLIAHFQLDLQIILLMNEQRDIQGLIENLQQKRVEARKPMLELFTDLNANDFETQFLTFFDVKPQKIVGPNPKHSFRQNARVILPQRVEEVYSWEQYIKKPEYREELHNMRISVKRLRYTMEFFAVNYDIKFTDFLDIIIDLQDILGDIHDNDVILDILTEYKNNSQSDELLGVDMLISLTQDNRIFDYNVFLNKWKQLSSTNFKQELLEIIAT